MNKELDEALAEALAEEGSLLPDLEEYEMFNDGWGDQ